VVWDNLILLPVFELGTIIERFQDYSRIRFEARAGLDCSGWRNNDPTERSGSNPFAARILIGIRATTIGPGNRSAP
jgi:hypothetical protein